MFEPWSGRIGIHDGAPNGRCRGRPHSCFRGHQYFGIGVWRKVHGVLRKGFRGVLCHACCEPPSTAAVRNNGGRYSPRSCIRTSVGCFWCMKSACLLHHARQFAAVAAIRASSLAIDHHSQGRCRTVCVACAARFQTVGAVFKTQEVRSDALWPRYAAAASSHPQ